MSAIIVGWGHTKFGRLEQSFEELIQLSAKEALADAGISGSDVDEVWLGHFNAGMVPDGFCSSMILGADDAMRFTPATRCENACASGSAALYSAIDAINSGRIKIALVVGAEKMTELDGAGVTKSLGAASYQKEEGGLSFPQIFAKFAEAYGEKYQDPVEAMAHIAVKNHANAMDNPLAQLHKEIDLEFCLNPQEKNPVIAPPLKMTDCSLVSDGAAAVVVVHSDLLGDFKRGVGFKAMAHVNDFLPISKKDLPAFEGPKEAFRQAYEQAGVTIGDIDFAEVHDCFTIAELLSLEAMGLAEAGGAIQQVLDGTTTKDGKLPINRSGGLKAKGHPVGATGVSMHVIAAKQLVGEAEDLQLPDAKLGMTFNMGGGAVANYVSILEAVK